jgi:hypothetical protein
MEKISVIPDFDEHIKGLINQVIDLHTEYEGIDIHQPNKKAWEKGERLKQLSSQFGTLAAELG